MFGRLLCLFGFRHWRSVSKKPTKPMPVLLYYARLIWHDHDGNEVDMAEKEPYRDERLHVGFWDGENFCENVTGHDAFESWRNDDQVPTHWQPAPAKPDNRSIWRQHGRWMMSRATDVKVV